MTTQILRQTLTKSLSTEHTLFTLTKAPFLKLRHWNQVLDSRKALAKLDRRLLDDIGITQIEAQTELNKPFWKT